MGRLQALFGTSSTGENDPILLPGEPRIEVRLNRSARARRLSLRVSRLDGRVTLTLPRGLPRREAESFAHEKAAWIRKHLSDIPVEITPMPGDDILFAGERLPVVAQRRRGVGVSDGALLVPDTRIDTTPARIAAFLKVEARTRLVTESEHFARQIGREIGRVTLRDTRSRWGSCSHEGNLMYSWRLIMAPPSVLTYVAAHEVSHLVHMDHSAAFWAQVEALFPNHKAERKWLRDNGGDLHRYRFRD